MARKVWAYASEHPDGRMGGVVGASQWEIAQEWFQEAFEEGLFIRTFATREEYLEWLNSLPAEPEIEDAAP